MQMYLNMSHFSFLSLADDPTPIHNHRVSCVFYSAGSIQTFRSRTCDTSSIGTFSDDLSFNNEEQESLPGPVSHVDRSNYPRSNDAQKIGDILSLSRPRSESPKRHSDMSRNLVMNRIRSMPKLEYSRSAHNRSTGQSMFESVDKCSNANGKADAAVNVAAFDMLLADL